MHGPPGPTTKTLPFLAVGSETVTPQFALPARWQITRLLGAGGQAEVWLARDQELDEWVAVKVFRGDISDTRRECMRREVRLGRSLSHPNLVRVYELIEAGEHLAVSMEWVREGSLASCLEDGPLEIGRVIAVADEALSVLAYLHDQGIVHRDGKPSNLLLDDRGRVRLADLGLARPLEPGSDLTTTATTVGTPGFMSPEQIRGTELTPASDLYSLGVALFHLLTGRMPSEGNSGFEIADRHLHKEPPSPRSQRPECPAWLAHFVLRLMEKSPRDRWPDAARALDALRRRRVMASPRTWRRAAAGAAAVGVVAVAATWAVRHLHPLPAGVRVVGNDVVVSDASGHQLWRKTFPGDAPTAAVGDVLGGGPQVAIGFGTAGRPGDVPDLAIFSPDGRELERICSTGATFPLYFPDFENRVGVTWPSMIDLDGDGKPELVWRTNHAVWYPSLVGAWNPRAGLSPSVLFVNSGTIHGVSGADLGGERRTLVISAINNPLGYQRVVALVEPVHQAGSAYQEGFSPDLFGEWSSAPRNGVVPVRAFTPIGPAGGVALVLAAGPSGIVLDVDRRRIELDADANPRGFPLYGAGSAGRTRFWNELAAACLDLAGGRGDSRAVVAGLRERHAAALAEPPMELALTLMLARSLAQAGNHGAAIDLLQTALAATPDDLDLLLRLGEQLAAVGNYGAAMDALARAHRVNIVGRNPLDAAVSRAELAAASGDEVRFRQVVEYSRASSEGGFRDVESQLLAFWAFCRGEWGAQDLVEEADDHNVPIVTVLRAWA